MKKLTEHACHCLRQIPGYLYQAEKDIPFLQELLTEFPSIDLIDEIKQWKAWPAAGIYFYPPNKTLTRGSINLRRRNFMVRGSSPLDAPVHFSSFDQHKPAPKKVIIK